MKKRIVKSTDEELIRMIESPEDFVMALRSIAKAEINKRCISVKRQKEVAESIYRKKVRKLLTGNIYSFSDLVPPKSMILSQKEIRVILKSEFESHRFRRNSLNQGLDKYG